MIVKKKTLMTVSVVAVCLLILSTIFFFAFVKKPNYPDIQTPKPFLGPENAKIKIIDFSDLECPFCRMAHPVMMKIVKDFEGDVSYQFYSYPLSIHSHAMLASQGAECANDQGKFYEFIDAVYASTGNDNPPAESVLNKVAESLGLDMKKFSACLGSGAKEDAVLLDMSYGSYMRISGTPSIFINGEKLDNWQYDNFKKVVEDKLASLEQN